MCLDVAKKCAHKHRPFSWNLSPPFSSSSGDLNCRHLIFQSCCSRCWHPCHHSQCLPKMVLPPGADVKDLIFCTMSLLFFFNIYILLKYSWLTMFQVHSKVIQLYKYTYIIFEIIFHHKLLQDTDCSSLCYTVNLCCLLHIYF